MGEKQMKKLENCQWKPRWVSHLGCIKGCLDYLGIDLSDAWLYGATGHSQQACPLFRGGSRLRHEAPAESAADR